MQKAKALVQKKKSQIATISNQILTEQNKQIRIPS